MFISILAAFFNEKKRFLKYHSENRKKTDTHRIEGTGFNLMPHASIGIPFWIDIIQQNYKTTYRKRIMQPKITNGSSVTDPNPGYITKTYSSHPNPIAFKNRFAVGAIFIPIVYTPMSTSSESDRFFAQTR